MSEAKEQRIRFLFLGMNCDPHPDYDLDPGIPGSDPDLTDLHETLSVVSLANNQFIKLWE